MTRHPHAPNEVVLQIAEPHQIDGLLPLVAAYHDFEGIELPQETRKRSVTTLLNDRRLGEIWQIRTPGRLIGYIALTFGYSIEFGGRDAFIDEFYIEPAERGGGIGAEVLRQVTAIMSDRGVLALHLEVDRTNDRAKSLYGRLGFSSREKYHLMSIELGSRHSED
jgi:ribosomal protein S18 acetylase RimI-like enzyme